MSSRIAADGFQIYHGTWSTNRAWNDRETRTRLAVGLLHVTPLRASRALSLRWLACYLSIPVAHCALVCPGILTADRRAVSTTASDIGDLVGGAQKTLLVGGGNVGEGPVGLGVQPCEVPWSLKEEWGERVAHAGSQDEVQAWIKALKLV